MKYLTLALVLLGLYACSPNPNYVTPAASPAQHELTSRTYSPVPPVTRAPSVGWGVARVVTPMPTGNDNLISVNTSGREVASIRANGRLYLNGREVHTDAQYRATMKAIMLGAMGCTNEKQLADATRVED